MILFDIIYKKSFIRRKEWQQKEAKKKSGKNCRRLSNSAKMTTNMTTKMI